MVGGDFTLTPVSGYGAGSSPLPEGEGIFHPAKWRILTDTASRQLDCGICGARGVCVIGEVPSNALVQSLKAGRKGVGRLFLVVALVALWDSSWRLGSSALADDCGHPCNNSEDAEQSNQYDRRAGCGVVTGSRWCHWSSLRHRGRCGGYGRRRRRRLHLLLFLSRAMNEQECGRVAGPAVGLPAQISPAGDSRMGRPTALSQTLGQRGRRSSETRHRCKSLVVVFRSRIEHERH